MPGWSEAPLPRLRELIVRTIFVCGLVLAPLHLWRLVIIEPLVPVYTTEIRFLAPEFTITSARINDAESPSMLRFEANLSGPIRYRDHTFVPFGWEGVPEGGFRINLTIDGLLEYSAVLLVVILVWPAKRWSELGLRGILAMPALAIVLLTEAPLTVVAELWQFVRAPIDPQGTTGWMVLSRFLMGGGGIAMALSLGALTIAIAHRVLYPRARPARDEASRKAAPTGYASLVVPKRAASTPAERTVTR